MGVCVVAEEGQEGCCKAETGRGNVNDGMTPSRHESKPTRAEPRTWHAPISVPTYCAVARLRWPESYFGSFPTLCVVAPAGPCAPPAAHQSTVHSLPNWSLPRFSDLQISDTHSLVSDTRAHMCAGHHKEGERYSCCQTQGLAWWPIRPYSNMRTLVPAAVPWLWSIRPP